jgi:Hemerythrin HHE cation binding domain
MTNGPLHRFFAADHRRLDALLQRSLSVPGQVDLVPFGEFRAGILKHIGMEEKVLFPAARHAREAPLALAARLRVDHGAIAALLVPTPTPALVAEILSVLGPHNRREEEPGGIYDACDEAVGPAEAERLVQELRAFPEVPLKAYNDGPAILAHIQETLELSRRQWRESEGGA